MKEHHKHHKTDNSLGGLLDRCGHYFAHRVGNKKRGQDSVLTVISQHPGIAQKELAEKLFVSDKAISKWERGQSLPDITMLNPLADVLGTTAAELLNCGKIKDEKIDASQVDEIIEKAISISDEEKKEKRKDLKKRLAIYFVCFAIGGVSTFLFYKKNGMQFYQSLLTIEILTAVFGAYFMFFIKERLPKYFDENKISVYSDGIFRLNTPGIYYNNRNWPHIIKNARISFMVIMAVFPVISVLLNIIFSETLAVAMHIAFTLGTIVGIFTPIYYGAIKYK